MKLVALLGAGAVNESDQKRLVQVLDRFCEWALDDRSKDEPVLLDWSEKRRTRNP